MTCTTLEEEIRAARDCLDLLPTGWWLEHDKIREAHQHMVNALVKIKHGQVTDAAHLRSVIDDVFHDEGSRANR